MEQDELYVRGKQMRLDIFGEPGIAGMDDADDFMDPLQDLVTRHCFGDVWSRDGLDLKTRSMITVAMIVGQARPNQLKNHVRGAVSNGVTKEEIREILVHASLYYGLPSVSDAWRQCREALEEVGAY